MAATWQANCWKAKTWQDNSWFGMGGGVTPPVNLVLLSAISATISAPGVELSDGVPGSIDATDALTYSLTPTDEGG
jgi:hypothetical protein